MDLPALQQAVQVLQDRQAILDCIQHYCRGIDRFDRALLLSAFHSDAIDDHGIHVGSPTAFADWVFAYHGEHQHLTQHIITNHSCELDRDIAHAETYWMVAANNKRGAPLSLSGGRYLDRFERRAGRWAIAARKCVIDWSGAPSEVPFSPEVMALFSATGVPARDRSDPSYERPLTVDPGRIGVHG
jgi:hypothetical protein